MFLNQNFLIIGDFSSFAQILGLSAFFVGSIIAYSKNFYVICKIKSRVN